MKHKKKKNFAWRVIKLTLLISIGMLMMYLIIYGLSNPLSLIENKFVKRGGVDINESILDGCQNLDLFNSAKCLHKNVGAIYGYNISNVGRDLTFEELKQQGGVCTHYSSLYYEAGKELGFYAEEVVIYMDDYTGHIFTVISNADGYCLLDGEIIECFKFVDGKSVK